MDEAQKAYEDSVEIKKKLFGNDHYETCISLAGLGNVFKYKKEFDKAIDCHTRYYEAYKSTFGDGNSYLAVILAGIGADHYEKGDYQKAFENHKKAIEILIACNEDIASSYYNCLGNDLYCMDKYEEAIEAYQHGMGCKNLKSNPFTRTIFLNCIARSYACMGEYIKAKPYFEEALEIRRQLFQEDDPRVVQCLDNVKRIEKYI